MSSVTWEQQSRMFQLGYAFFLELRDRTHMPSIFYVHDVDSSIHPMEGSTGRSEELEIEYQR